MITQALYYLATVLQGLAVVYALYLMRRRGGRSAWAWLVGTMLAMLTWRVVMMLDIHPPRYFNPLIATWGSSCLFLSMFFFGREIARRERAETERTRVEGERDALLESERAAREGAERANRLKDQFLGALSHELRTPLTAVLGWCELLQSPGGQDEPEQVAEAIATIERNAKAQARLIEDLLDVTRINAGTLRLDVREVPMAAMVEAAAETIRPTASAKGVEMAMGLDRSAGVAGDVMRLQQVVWNLLANAVKFTPAGGKVTVRLSAAGDEVVLEVSDDGEGISADFLPHLFTRFRQADGSASRRHGGLGLGLAIVRSLVEMHGGRVGAQSAGPGKGSRFTVTLPAWSSEVSMGRRALAGPAVAPQGQPAGVNGEAARLSAMKVVSATALAGLRILVVDDEADLRGMVVRLLERHGAAAVRSAGSAAEAMRLIPEFEPDVLVSDIGMPGEDGYTFIRRLRATTPPERGGAVPAVALTAYARDVDRGRAIASGFGAHVVKPVNPAELIGAILQVTAEPARRGVGAGV